LSSFAGEDSDVVKVFTTTDDTQMDIKR